MMKVMLVENEELILQGIRNILDWEALGLEVVHMAHDGQEALAMWEKEPVHIVVTDISMPVMDGLTLLKSLRQQNICTPVILATALNRLGDRIDGLDAGADDYIVKPFSLDELGARVAAHIRRERRRGDTPKVKLADKLAIDYTEDGCSMTGRKFLLQRRSLILWSFCPAIRGRFSAKSGYMNLSGAMTVKESLPWWPNMFAEFVRSLQPQT